MTIVSPDTPKTSNSKRTNLKRSSVSDSNTNSEPAFEIEHENIKNLVKTSESGEEKVIEFGTVFFNKNKLKILTHDNKQYFFPKQICKDLRIDWAVEKRRVVSDNFLFSILRLIDLPEKIESKKNRKIEKHFILPIEYLNGFLFGLNEKKLKQGQLLKLLNYKKDCYIVLYEYFNSGIIFDIDKLDSSLEFQDFVYRKLISFKTSQNSLLERIRIAFINNSEDYDNRSQIAIRFSKLIVDKIFYGITKNTPNELIYNRLSDKFGDNFGMKSFNKDREIKSNDLNVAKYYLNEIELRRYENIGEQLLLKIESRVLNGDRISMFDWLFEINELLRQNGYEILFDYSSSKISKLDVNSKVNIVWKKVGSTKLDRQSTDQDGEIDHKFSS
jgi:uncharacterized pyridoxamine 5'-phosphate oxidase family protein